MISTSRSKNGSGKINKQGKYRTVSCAYSREIIGAFEKILNFVNDNFDINAESK